jgi:hypothetical protein
MAADGPLARSADGEWRRPGVLMAVKKREPKKTVRNWGDVEHASSSEE